MSGAESGRPAWYAVHTRSRHERKVLEQLRALPLEAYLPEYLAWSRRRDRRKRILRPLFPGYLFVRTEMTPARRLDIIKARSVVRIVGVRHQPVPVPDHQVESVRRLLAVGRDAGPHPLVAGRQVTVMDGPLAGVVGVVVGERRKKIVVQVELLGRAVAASLEASVLAPFFSA